MIYLMRHGQAMNFEQHPNRPLSQQGIDGVHKIADLFVRQQIQINKIYHSSVERSKQTAEIMAVVINSEIEVELLPALEPDLDIRVLTNVIPTLPDNCLLVGHLPNLELCSNFLMTYDISQPTIQFLPGAVAAFQVGANTCVLNWFVNPGLF